MHAAAIVIDQQRPTYGMNIQRALSLESLQQCCCERRQTLVGLKGITRGHCHCHTQSDAITFFDYCQPSYSLSWYQSHFRGCKTNSRLHRAHKAAPLCLTPACSPFQQAIADCVMLLAGELTFISLGRANLFHLPFSTIPISNPCRRVN